MLTDRGNHRIHQIDAAGKVVRIIGFRGKIEGQLENPSGIAVSPDGKCVFVADRGNNRVAIFNLLCSSVHPRFFASLVFLVVIYH